MIPTSMQNVVHINRIVRIENSQQQYKTSSQHIGNERWSESSNSVLQLIMHLCCNLFDCLEADALRPICCRVPPRLQLTSHFDASLIILFQMWVCIQTLTRTQSFHHYKCVDDQPSLGSRSHFPKLNQERERTAKQKHALFGLNQDGMFHFYSAFSPRSFIASSLRFHSFTTLSGRFRLFLLSIHSRSVSPSAQMVWGAVNT